MTLFLLPIAFEEKFELFSKQEAIPHQNIVEY